jgi:hypothetical protein
MTTRSWIDEEPPASTAVRQTVALVRAGLARPVALLVTAVTFATLVVGVSVLRERAYAPAYVLRVVESSGDPGASPSPRRQLRDYVRLAVFTSAPLLDLIRRHHLYPSLAAKNPRAALASFREDIDVDVYQNYFVEQRTASSGPRSARVRVRYHHPDPTVATAVTRDLGNLIVAREKVERRDQAARAEERAKHEVELARRALTRRLAEVAAKRQKLNSSPVVDPQDQVELVGLLGSLPELERQQDEAEAREAALSLGAALERRGIGLSFTVIDDATLSSGVQARNARIILTLASLAFGLPLVTMAVGAFGPRKGSV